MDIARLLKNRVTFIIGSKKNAGKTVFLNYAVKKLRGRTRMAYLSVGIDGEGTDLVFGHPKPGILARKGDIVLTSEAGLKATDAACEVLNVYPFHTALGRPVLIRVLRDGNIEITGPENNAQLGPVFSDIRRFGAETVLVDGAADRITQVSSKTNSAFVHVSRIAPEDLDSSLAGLRLIHSLSKVPVLPGRPGRSRGEGTFFMPGAVTPAKLEAVDKNTKRLVIENMTRIFLPLAAWKALSGKYEVYFREKFDLRAFIVNLYNISQRDFEKKLDDEQLFLKLIYNPCAI
jgi:hypothetical protein